MKKLTSLAVALITIVPLCGEDWLQFRGPNSAGVSNNRNLPVEFGPNKNVVWKTDLPPGYSSPVLVGDRIFLTAVDNDKLFTIALTAPPAVSTGAAKFPGRVKESCTTERPRLALPDQRRQKCLRLLLRLWPDLLRPGWKRALEKADRALQ